MPHTIYLGRKSWTAYIPLVIGHAFMLLVVTWIASLLAPRWAPLCALAVLLLAAYRIAAVRSWYLFADEQGVWMAGGILPWTRSLQGVKWRDLDTAVCRNGFWQWLLHSYEVRVSHRFTKSAELHFSHLHNGHHAAGAIHQMHMALLSPPGATAGPRLVETD